MAYSEARKCQHCKSMKYLTWWIPDRTLYIWEHGKSYQNRKNTPFSMQTTHVYNVTVTYSAALK